MKTYYVAAMAALMILAGCESQVTDDDVVYHYDDDRIDPNIEIGKDCVVITSEDGRKRAFPLNRPSIADLYAAGQTVFFDQYLYWPNGWRPDGDLALYRGHVHHDGAPTLVGVNSDYRQLIVETVFESNIVGGCIDMYSLMTKNTFTSDDDYPPPGDPAGFTNNIIYTPNPEGEVTVEGNYFFDPTPIHLGPNERRPWDDCDKGNVIGE